jgi:hypothetical protein
MLSKEERLLSGKKFCFWRITSVFLLFSNVKYYFWLTTWVGY